MSVTSALYLNGLFKMKKKIYGLLILLSIYLIATAIGLGSFYLLNGKVDILVNILISDVIATIFVWATGLIFKTASVYDPYWSLQTLVIYLGLLFYYQNWTIFTIIPLIAIILYSIRLTTNFCIGFHDLSYVDWRYKMLAKKSGKLFQLVNLFGICMFPTLVVYSASIPLMVYANNTINHGYWDIVGSLIILGGTLLELITDIQMKKFIKIRASREEVINIGLWKYSRHPNYLGEILIWFGVAAILIISNPNYWYFLFGAIINLLMFIFISIPMEENHMKEYKPLMNEYISKTSPLLILPNRKSK